MACTETVESGNDFDLNPSINSFRREFSIELPGTAFEFATPGIREFEFETPRLVPTAEDLIQNGKFLVIHLPAEKISQNRASEQGTQRRTGFAECFRMNKNKNSDTDSTAKNCGWKQIFEFKKPEFLPRSSSAREAEKPISDPWLQRARSDSKAISRYMKRNSLQGKQLQSERAGRVSPARMEYPRSRSKDSVASTPADMGPNKLQKSMQQGGRRDDLKKFLEKPKNHQLGIHLPRFLRFFR